LLAYALRRRSPCRAPLQARRRQLIHERDECLLGAIDGPVVIKQSFIPESQRGPGDKLTERILTLWHQDHTSLLRGRSGQGR
jgi:hypothetical protein